MLIKENDHTYKPLDHGGNKVSTSSFCAVRAKGLNDSSDLGQYLNRRPANCNHRRHVRELTLLN